NQMGQSNLDIANYLQTQMQSYDNPQLRDEVLYQAQGLGGKLEGIANTASNQLGAGGGAAAAQQYLSGASNFDQFSFDPTQSTLAQTRAFADEMGQTARTLAADQSALGMRQSEDMLDAALAGRGFSRNSGAAAAGLAQLQQ